LSPRAVGTSILFTGSASNGTGNFEYQFRVRDLAGVWSTPQTYSTTPTWPWNTTGLTAGTYRVVVWVRNVGSTAQYETYAFVDYLLQ
ncbi:MAG: hypothetical protein IH608_13555, partial [Proteobacteria bacterium]|nr:hypothetical protein [Pseudomonadota bacterium]